MRPTLTLLSSTTIASVIPAYWLRSRRGCQPSESATAGKTVHQVRAALINAVVGGKGGGGDDEIQVVVQKTSTLGVSLPSVDPHTHDDRGNGGLRDSLGCAVRILSSARRRQLAGVTGARRSSFKLTCRSRCLTAWMPMQRLLQR